MKDKRQNTRIGLLPLDGNRFPLPYSVVSLVFSALVPVSFILHWPALLLASFMVPAIVFSPAFLVITGWEIIRYQRSWRIIFAATIYLAATVISWGTLTIHALGRFP